MKHYAIWDKTSPVICPSGDVFTAEEWMNRYPVARLDSVTILCAPGEINGAFFGTLGQLEARYEDQIDFSSAATPQEKLDLIEAYEDARAKEAAATVSNETLTAVSLATIAANMEYQNMLLE